MASLVSKLIRLYQKLLVLCLDVKLSLEIRESQECFSFYRRPEPPLTISAGSPLRAGKKIAPRDTRTHEEWWEGQRRELQSQAAPSSQTYSNAVRRNIPQEALILRQEPNNGNPALQRVPNTPSKPASGPLSAELQPEPLLVTVTQPKPSPGVNPPPLILHPGVKPAHINPASTPMEEPQYGRF